MKTLKALGRYKKGLGGLAAITVVMLLASIWAGNVVDSRPAVAAAGEERSEDTGLLVPDDADTSAVLVPAQADPESPERPEFGMGGMALRVIGSVAFVIGLLYVGMHVMRAVSRRGGRGGVRDDAISVLHKRHIAPKKAIYVVKVANRAMVVGVTDSQINHLADLSEEELAEIRVMKPSKTSDFKRQLLGFAMGTRDKA
jgi:flagellar biosynthetic protein FliO